MANLSDLILHGPLRWLRQSVAITRLNLQTISQRLGSSVVALVGVAGVVAVFIAVLSIAAGFRQTLVGAGEPDVAVVLRAGSESEMTSGLGLDQTRIIADAPGIKRDAAGRPMASAELFVVINLDKRDTGTEANVPLRGIQQEAFEVRDDVQIVAGRSFQPGRNELIVGQGARQQFAGLELGDKLRLGENDWTVVGVFSAGGAVEDSELWCDAKVLQPAYRRGNSFQSVYVRLESPQTFDAFKDALTSDPRLNVDVTQETEYYAEQSSVVTSLITNLGVAVAVLMGLGAIFGALITMYSAVSSRTREIATLRALGFAGSPVVVSVLVESMLLAVIGGTIGGVLAYLAFNGYQTSTINWQSFSQVTFAFAVTPELMVEGIVYALIIGLIGGLLPAVRAARIPVAEGLRER